jgi:signal transduction histidine kinase
MSAQVRELERQCEELLRDHIRNPDELSLHRAYELGRRALAKGVGVMDMAATLWAAILDVGPNSLERDTELRQRIEAFVLESMSPFEMMHRGVREANMALRQFESRREEEARRIARELHDEAGQLLATVYFALEALRGEVTPSGEAQLTRVYDLLHHVEESIRRIAHELRPTILDDLGLLPALQFLAEGVSRRSGVRIDVKGWTSGRLSPAVETALYRITQEALTNVTRHARARHATVQVTRTPQEIVCRIRDDGRGFDPSAVATDAAGRGLGLEGIRERVSTLGGVLEIDSGPTSGTELLVRLPLEVIDAHAHHAGG